MPENKSDAVVAQIYNDGLFLIVSGRQYFAAFEEYKVFEEAKSADLFNITCDGNKLYWPSLSLEIPLKILEISIHEKVYSYPNADIVLVVVSVVVATAIIIILGQTALFGHDSDPDQLQIDRWFFALFTAFSVCQLYKFSNYRQRIFVNKDGIRLFSKDTIYTAFSWDEVTSIIDYRLNKLVRIKTKAKKQITIYYSLVDVDEILEIIQAKTGLQIIRHRPWYHFVFPTRKKKDRGEG